jgi:2-hydroxychromene-2-carboxylate isomerase
MNPRPSTSADFVALSYIASERIAALAARHGHGELEGVLLGVTFQAAELKSPVSYPIKREYSLRDFARSARFEGVPYMQPEPFPIATQNAARVFWWLHDTRGADAAAAWARAGLRAFFTRGVALNDPATLKQLAAESGPGGDEAERVWNDAAWKERLKRANEAAVAAGVFGAPYFVVDGEPFWGNDASRRRFWRKGRSDVQEDRQAARRQAMTEVTTTSSPGARCTPPACSSSTSATCASSSARASSPARCTRRAACSSSGSTRSRPTTATFSRRTRSTCSSAPPAGARRSRPRR